MANSSLRVVGEGGMDKQKALEAALGQIERAFGKGSVMKLGQGGTATPRHNTSCTYFVLKQGACVKSF